MARSFTYDRPLDVKIIPVSENSQHEFQFQTVLGIKKEVEDVPSDEEIGLPEAKSASNLEVSSSNTSKMQPNDGIDGTRPHLVIKFRDLLTRSGQSYGISRKNKKREREYLTEDKLMTCEVDRIKRRRSEPSIRSERQKFESRITTARRRSELGITSEKRHTRSSVRQHIRSNCDNVKKNGTLNSSQLNEIGEDAKNKSDSNSPLTTDSSKSENIFCDVCGLDFTNHQSLQAHINYYSTDGKFRCNVCGLRFPRILLLSRHSKAHSGIPRKYWYRYKCHICMDYFNRKSGFIGHVAHLHAKEFASIKESESLYKEVVESMRMRNQASGKKSIESVRDSNNEDEQVGDTFRDQQDTMSQDISLHNQVAKVAVDSDYKTVDTSLTRQSLKYAQASNLAQCNGDKVMVQQKREPLKTDSEQVSIGIKKSQKIIDNSASSSNQVFNENRGLQESREYTEQVNELPRGSDRRLSTFSEDIPPKLQQYSVQRLGKSTKDESLAYEFHPHQDSTNEKKRPPSHEQLNYQVGTVLSHDELEEKVDVTTVNADVNNSAVKRITCENNLITTDDFGESRQSIFVGHQDKDTDGKSCKSITLSMAVSSSSVPRIGSQSIEFYDATMPSNYKISNYKIIKDVKVSLVKLENMVDLPKIDTTKSSVLNITRLLNTEKPNCYVCEKPFANRGRWRISRQQQEKTVEYYEKSRSFVEEQHGTIGYCPQVLSNDGGSEERGKWETTKPTDKTCYICNKFFQNKRSLVSHYMTIHVEPGSFRCCLCHAYLRNSKRLTSHIFKHLPIEKILLKYCRSCNVELNMFSLNKLCAACEKEYKFNWAKFKRTKFDDIPMLDEQGLAYKIACQKKGSSDNSRELPNETSVVMSPNDVKVSSTVHDSGKSDLKVERATTFDEISKDFKYSGPNRLFLQSSTADADLEYCKPKTQIEFISDDCKKITRTYNYKSRPNTSKVGLKKHIRSISFATHDQGCTKNLMARRRSKFFKKKFTVKRRIKRPHFRSNTKKSFHHRCKTCGLNCCCVKNLKIHERRYSTNGKNVCKMCGLTFARKHVLITHMKTAHNPKPLFSRIIRCEICNQGFCNKKFLRIHLAHFHNIKYFQCQVCKIKFNASKYLNDHKRYHSKSINLPCDSCGQTFNCKHALEYHQMQIHKPEESKSSKYLCGKNDFAFSDKLLLQADVGQLHVLQDNNSIVTTSTKGVRAPADQHLKDIGISAKTEDAFINSDVGVTNSIVSKHENEIQCEEAVHEARNLTAIKAHTLSQYKCDICKISFVEPHDILDHEWEYSNYGTNVCAVCNRKFMTKSHLEKHKVKHFRRDVICIYKCHVCKEEFPTEDDLKMHGLHLHGPQFMFEKSSETSDSCESVISNCKKIQDSDGVANKFFINDNTDDTFGSVMVSEIAENERILLFQTILNGLSVELRIPNTTEETYRCNFCTLSFGTSSLLKNHMKKHAYRPYYTNSSKYLCLICKNTFRTNEILRAHVIHYHTLDHKQSTTSKSEPSGEPIDESLTSQTGVNHHNPTCISDQDVEDTVEISPSNQADLNQSFNLPKHYSAVDVSSTVSSETKSQSSDSTDCVHELQHNHDHPPPLSEGIQCKTKTILGDSDPHKSDGKNCRDSESMNVHTIENISSQAKVMSVSVNEELFTSDLEKVICTICTQNFGTVDEIQAHVTSVHMMNGEYACTYCGEIFSYFMDLKRHTFRLDEDSENYACCREKFRHVTKLADNTSSLKNRHGKKQNEQLSSFDEAEMTLTSSEKPSSNNSINLGKRDIRGEYFPNITTSLEHWDSYFGKDRFRCNLCDITFIDQRLLNVHNMKHYQKGQEPHSARNLSGFELNVHDQTVQTRKQYGVMMDKKLQDGAAVTSNVVSTNISGDLRRVPIATDKLLKQIISSRLQARLAKILPIAEDENKPHINKQIIVANDVSRKDDLQLNLVSEQDTDLSNKRDVITRCEIKHSIAKFRKKISSGLQREVSPIVTYPVQSTPTVGIRYEQIPSKFPRNSSDENSSYKMLMASTNDEVKNRDVPVKSIENKCTNQKQPSLQSQVLSTVRNSVPIAPTIRSSRMLDHTHIPSSQKSRIRRCADDEGLEVVPLSSDGTGNSTYFVYMKPTVDSSNANEALDVVRIPIEKPRVKEYTAQKLPSSIPPTSGPDVRPLHHKRVESSSDSFSGRVNNKPTVAPKDRNLKPHIHGGVQKRLLKILPNRSNVVISPLPGSRFERNGKAGNSGGNNLHNASDPRGVNSGGNENTKILTRLNIAGDSSTNPALTLLCAGERKGVDNPVNDASKDMKLKDKIFRCSYCTMLFNEKNQLVEHMLAHKADNQCPACGLRFSNDKALQQHLPEHRSSKCIKCNKVNFFNDPPCYPVGTFAFCSQCNAVLPPPLRTLAPSSTNSTRRIMTCGICMQTFSTISQMSVHFRKSHLSFVCGICSLAFSSQLNLTKHMQAHSGK